MPEIPEIVVVVTGPFGAAAVDRWGRLIAEAVEARPARLVVDLQQAPAIDAAAIAVLLQAHRAMIHAGGRLRLRAPVQRVREILSLARLAQVFEIEDAPAAV